jgi:hypothetical protein
MCQNLDLRFLPFIAFCQVFSLPLFRFFDLTFYCLFSFFLFGFFNHPLFFPFFFALVLYLFFLVHVVSSLAYPTCLGIKGLVVVVVLFESILETKLQILTFFWYNPDR